MAERMRMRVRPVVLLLSAAIALQCTECKLCSEPADASIPATIRHFVTEVVQFRKLSGGDYLDGCDFHLNGVVTLVDTNRDLLILQDATGAVALHTRLDDHSLTVGELVELEGFNCSPYFEKFPDYPYRPSGWDVRDSFEAPSNWGEYYLTRMRGYLHPPVSGQYTFWIASDNSSELWLSSDNRPSNSKKIAFISRFEWVAPHQWTKFPSQRSEPIWLDKGKSYYIEALQEQTTLGDNLAVAWGSATNPRVITAANLTPWNKGRSATANFPANGILREYWTNYSAGDLTGLGGAGSFESALSVEQVRVKAKGPGPLPKPDRLTLNQAWGAENNFRWVEAEGMIKFIGEENGVVSFELSQGQAQVQVRASCWHPAISNFDRNVPVRVQGVCEGRYDQNGALVPGLIWASTPGSVQVIEAVQTNEIGAVMNQPALAALNRTNPPMQGFYGTRGVVTFNDRVFGKNYLFVQEDTAVVLVALDGLHIDNRLQVGEWVDLGGALQPAKYLPVLTPLAVTELGWRSMPEPLTDPIRVPVPGNRDGRWTEIEGVGRSVNSNDTISLMGKAGPVCLWIGRTPTDCLARYVDAKLRVRGVLSLSALDVPLLLIPSRSFVDVEETQPEDPFAISVRPVANLIVDGLDVSRAHRARVAGEVTYQQGHTFFVQDRSGGIRVETRNAPVVKVGETVEVVGFPTENGPGRILTEALVRAADPPQQVAPKELDLNDALSSRQRGTLVRANATLLNQKTIGTSQVLELQEQQRVFAAKLLVADGSLPAFAPGSRLRITGVCESETPSLPDLKKTPPDGPSAGLLNLWLRSPADVALISGPPWWTLTRIVALAGTLAAVLLITLLWVHLLRRRLERQHAAQIASSQQILKSLENERRRIAANLHDSLGQILLAIKNQTLLTLQRAPEEAALRQRLNEISGTTSQAIEEVRQITHGLRPYQLDRIGLTQAIRAIVSSAPAGGPISFASRVEDIDNVFGKDSEIHVYRIVQEAVTNVLKHSNATEATVVIKKRSNVVSLSIRDNGQGFDVQMNSSSKPRDLGYGLSGIAERVRILEGNLAVDSRPGQGTSVTVEVPLPGSNDDARNHNTDRG